MALLVDVLHYSPPAVQRSIVERLAAAVPPGLGLSRTIPAIGTKFKAAAELGRTISTLEDGTGEDGMARTEEGTQFYLSASGDGMIEGPS